MIEAAIQGFAGVTAPYPLLLMAIGIVIGSLGAILPGIGSTALAVMAMPFAMTMGPFPAIALLVSMNAVSSTASAIVSVCTGIPGSSSSLATIMDGFPMAKRGEGARGCGAGLSASILGGVAGAFFLFAAIPILKPLVMALGSPEYFMLAFWGISMVATLSGKMPFKGLVAGLLGILIMMVGMDPKSGVPRYVFGQPYLWDGINLVLVGMGVFGVSEALSMAIRGKSIAEGQVMYGSGLLRGIKDTLQNWFLVIRGSFIGAWIGFLPGVGGPTACWIAYGQAAQTCKKGNFGKGDVRGVIAPESANNATDGGSYITTLAFGIPGSTLTALHLIVFLAVGLQPGPAMLGEQLPFTFAVIWTLVLGNVIGGFAALALAKPIARMTFWPFHSVVPVIFVLVILGAFTANYAIQDFIMLAFFSTLGYFMKRFGWPRAPLLLGVVLGPIMEKYLWLSTARYGAEWMLRPGVILLFGLIIATVVLLPLWRARQEKKARPVVTGD